jgi:hypothetical protein
MKVTHLLQKSDQSIHKNSTTGRSSPLGATPLCNGVNFGMYSRDAIGVALSIIMSKQEHSNAARF